MGLQGAALEQIDPVLPGAVKAAGVFHIHRVVVDFFQRGHDQSKIVGKFGAAQQAVEVDDIRHLHAGEPQLPVMGRGSHVRLHEKHGVRVHLPFVQALQIHRAEAVFLQVDQVHLVLGVFVLVAVLHQGRSQGVVQLDKAGVVVRLPVHGSGAHAEDQAQHTLVVERGVGARHIQVLGVAHAGDVGIVIGPPPVAADAHDQQGHLLVPVKEVALGPVLEGVGADGAGVNGAHRVFKHPVPLL